MRSKAAPWKNQLASRKSEQHPTTVSAAPTRHEYNETDSPAATEKIDRLKNRFLTNPARFSLIPKGARVENREETKICDESETRSKEAVWPIIKKQPWRPVKVDAKAVEKEKPTIRQENGMVAVEIKIRSGKTTLLGNAAE